VYRAILIVNPAAGRKRSLQTLIPALVQVLERRGIHVDVAGTTAAGTAQALAEESVGNGYDVVFACGGDGTVHEVLQGVVGTTTMLGVVPMGTANALARNLHLSTDPVKALEQQADFVARPISVGEVRYASGEGAVSRYFTVMAGAGADGALVYRQLTTNKSRFGRSAYYTHAARLFLTQRFPAFRVEYRGTNSTGWEEQTGVSVMCARVGDLGGVFSRLTRGDFLFEPDLQLVIVKPPAHIGLPAWFALSSAGLHVFNPWVKTVRVSEFRCTPLAFGQRIHAEVDGEWIGQLPMSVRLLPQAVSLLIPKG